MVELMERTIKLTPAEFRVAVAVASGKTVAQLGKQLKQSPKALRNTLSQVYLKLGLSGHGAARELALRRDELLGKARSRVKPPAISPAVSPEALAEPEGVQKDTPAVESATGLPNWLENEVKP